MAPMKRPAASSASSAEKKAKGSTASKQFKEVAAALSQAEGWPKGVLAMLGENLQSILGQPKEERHDTQVRCAEMVAEIMKSIEENIQNQIKEAENKLAEAGTEKARREEKAAADSAEAAAKAAALEEAKKALDEATKEGKEAQKAVQAATKEQKAGDAENLANEEKKKDLDAALETIFKPLKEGAIEESARKKAIADVTKLGKEFVFDNALLTSLPSALSKKPEERGSFDGLVVNQLEKALTENAEKLAATLEAAAPAKQARADKVAEAQAALDAVTAKVKDCQEAVKNAEAALKEAETTSKASAKSVKQFGPEMKQTEASLSEAKENLESFASGAKATFQELVDKSSVVPEAEAAPAADEAAAPAEAEAAEAAPAAAA
eukprot:TRINITY_DN102191_c0_g1_i1.p2 TRINITY_DN102191_c0_g1~~TRINITY_DN102191_c0_g1_i1.p2  ORF type:complete len:380 (+),score=153.58 TRINITY_DN102191_c0_g1_i1:78-1217(+)